MKRARCEKSTTSNCWSDRATGLRTDASQRPRSAGCKTTSHTPCNAASPDVCGACPSPKRPDTFWAFFSPFLPFSRRLPGIFCVAITPGRGVCAPRPAAPCNRGRAEAGGAIGRLQASHTPNVFRSMRSRASSIAPQTTGRLAQAYSSLGFPLSRCLLLRRCL